EARARYGDLPWLGDELVVVGDAGEVWVGPAAFLTCLWALVDWRPWAYRLAEPAFVPLVERFFLLVSSRRKSLAALMAHDWEGGQCGIGRGAAFRRPTAASGGAMAARSPSASERPLGGIVCRSSTRSRISSRASSHAAAVDRSTPDLPSGPWHSPQARV